MGCTSSLSLGNRAVVAICDELGSSGHRNRLGLFSPVVTADNTFPSTMVQPKGSGLYAGGLSESVVFPEGRLPEDVALLGGKCLVCPY